MFARALSLIAFLSFSSISYAQNNSILDSGIVAILTSSADKMVIYNGLTGGETNASAKRWVANLLKVGIESATCIRVAAKHERCTVVRKNPAPGWAADRSYQFDVVNGLASDKLIVFGM